MRSWATRERGARSARQTEGEKQAAPVRQYRSGRNGKTCHNLKLILPQQQQTVNPSRKILVGTAYRG